jgi:hypothetical protein
MSDAEPRKDPAREITLWDFVLELRGPANLTREEVEAQHDAVVVELGQAVAALQSKGLRMSPGW